MPAKTSSLLFNYARDGYAFDYDDTKCSGELWAYNVTTAVGGQTVHLTVSVTRPNVADVHLTPDLAAWGAVHIYFDADSGGLTNVDGLEHVAQLGGQRDAARKWYNESLGQIKAIGSAFVAALIAASPAEIEPVDPGAHLPPQGTTFYAPPTGYGETEGAIPDGTTYYGMPQDGTTYYGMPQDGTTYYGLPEPEGAVDDGSLWTDDGAQVYPVEVEGVGWVYTGAFTIGEGEKFPHGVVFDDEGNYWAATPENLEAAAAVAV